MQTKRSLPKLRRRRPHKRQKNGFPNESKCVICGEGHTAESNKFEFEKKKKVIKKSKPAAEWEDEELFKSWQEKMSLQDQNHNRTLHISYAKCTRKRKEHSTHGE